MQKQDPWFGLQERGLFVLILLGLIGCTSKMVIDPIGGSISNTGGAGGEIPDVGITLQGGSIALPDVGLLIAVADGPLVVPWPPPDYVNVTWGTVGQYGLGPEITGGKNLDAGLSETEGTLCSGLYGVVRDFKMSTQPGGHPDFEIEHKGLVTGIVQNTLGADRKPVYSSGTPDSTNGKKNFDQWFRDTPNVNRTYILGLKLNFLDGIPTFSAIKPDKFFFPLDNQGFGNQGEPHNYSFTTEIHTAFVYKGGETFSFSGDDDVWVFINKKLVIDLGGRHAQMDGSVNVDELGLEKGKEYELAIFHAERHTTESNFQIQSTMEFVNCGNIVY
jgi:fibro-slime domain-containing protein